MAHIEAFPNAAQRRIIEHLNGSVLVTAPAGTGKTRVLARRVSHAVEKGMAEPRRILCLTFTNRAAEEMRRAVRDTGAPWAGDVVIKTFHGLCTYLLRAEARWIGLPADFVIYDEEDCKQLLRPTRGMTQAELLNAISDAKHNAAPAHLSLNFPLPEVAERVFAPLAETGHLQAALTYQRALQVRDALDFGDLVYCTRAMLHCLPDVRERWASRFDFIQVDEMQDTHPTEYELMRLLGEGSGNVALIGDLSQTIYGWRGSMPTEVVAAFKRDFEPTPYALTDNYRATRILLKAADSFARACGDFDGRYAPLVPAELCTQGANIELARCRTEVDEARWIGGRLVELSQTSMLVDANTDSAPRHPFRFSRAAILTRTNKRARVIYGEINEAVPCVTVETFEFFRREEVKDALAYMRLLTNPHDQSAMRRIRVPGIGDATLTNIMREAESIGARLTDLANATTLATCDPFRTALDAYANSDVVVFDTETTGINPAADEIIEIAAQRLRHGQPIAHFHRLIRVADVGNSVKVHGITNAELAEHGEPAALVLGDFANFAHGAVLVGHNVGFDLRMLDAALRRNGLQSLTPTQPCLDTHTTARRFVQAENYRLSTLATHFGLSTIPTHRADADVQTTVALLAALVPLMRAQAAQRATLIAQHAPIFRPLAQSLAQWHATLHAGAVRPVELLRLILNETRLMNRYRDENRERRRGNLSQLLAVFNHQDDLTLHPHLALCQLLEYTALAHNADQLARDEDRVMICTVHQSKGLEFDHVFIAGATDGEMPGFYAQKSGDREQLREEERLFYVAMTRARERLFITHHTSSSFGARGPSPFLGRIEAAYCTEVS